jgi:hypothetical protein
MGGKFGTEIGIESRRNAQWRIVGSDRARGARSTTCTVGVAPREQPACGSAQRISCTRSAHASRHRPKVHQRRERRDAPRPVRMPVRRRPRADRGPRTPHTSNNSTGSTRGVCRFTSIQPTTDTISLRVALRGLPRSEVLDGPPQSRAARARALPPASACGPTRRLHT